MARAGGSDALAAYRRLLAAWPLSLPGWVEFAHLLRLAGQFPEAKAACAEALRLDAHNQDAANTLGQILIQEGDWPALRLEIERRLAGFSGAKALWDLSNVSLMFGDMPLGWDQYEARWEIPGLIGPERSFNQPRWDGRPFPGRTLLLHWEQGQGDTLMFLRYAALAKARGGTVLVEAQASLADVAATCPGVDRVIAYGQELPHFDLQLPLLSLPAVFRTDLASIPAEIPYLDIPERVPNRALLAQILAPTQGLVRVGLTWCGSPTNPYNKLRSIPAADLAPLREVPGVVWHSFQPGLDAEPFQGIVPFGPLLSNFSDTAYALSGMDLLITVDTAVAHLAGAMGVPVLLMVACLPDWRWLMGREDSPWYPSMRIYRQPTHHDWASVIRRIVKDLVAGDPD